MRSSRSTSSTISYRPHRLRLSNISTSKTTIGAICLRLPRPPKSACFQCWESRFRSLLARWRIRGCSTAMELYRVGRLFSDKRRRRRRLCPPTSSRSRPLRRSCRRRVCRKRRGCETAPADRTAWPTRRTAVLGACRPGKSGRRSPSASSGEVASGRCGAGRGECASHSRTSQRQASPESRRAARCCCCASRSHRSRGQTPASRAGR
jgi:hypothetical protein